jgi:hypothetical protein
MLAFGGEILIDGPHLQSGVAQRTDLTEPSVCVRRAPISRLLCLMMSYSFNLPK